MKKALSLSCLHAKHKNMANNPIYGIKTIQNEFHCSSPNDDYAVIGSDTYEDFHQRCSSKSSGASSVDTYTLKIRMENLEMALTMLRTNFHRMEKALNKQLEKTIDFITCSDNENEPDLLSGKKEKQFMKSENSKLVKAVQFLTESSKIMRSALAEHSEVINRLADTIEQPIEIHQQPNEKRIESPIERKINKYKNHHDTIHVLCPKPIISEYFVVEDDAAAYKTLPASCFCGGKSLQNMNNEKLNRSAWANSAKVNNIKETNILNCNCETNSGNLDLDVETDGEYVTLIQNYIINCNKAYQWYDKPRDEESHYGSTMDTPVASLDECKGTLV